MSDEVERRRAIRKCVELIEEHTKHIAARLRWRRAEYRHAKELGVDPEVLAALIRERAAGKARTAMHRRELAKLRKIVR